MVKIFELKEHRMRRLFKLTILKMKEYANLWYDKLKRNRAREEGEFDTY